ncbi:MAG: bifunctional folylpolyglutamate synthase/dihydrofolate synthase [Bacteroidales bacterium]|nr:bifunctional folylpolyglutamate synthase/dihydrofolate synthase [Bacteroidales bacterium]
MDYKERIERLFSRHRSVQTSGFSSDAYKPGLAGMERLDSLLGHPHTLYPTVHVAGTNGKGTVCSMIAAALAAQGLRVGLYTSPHLLDFRERMKIVTAGGWSVIPESAVMEFLQRWEPECDDLSFFEITTGMAFKWFADSAVDAAVIETGLGGRLDSTNIITPRVSVITSIGLDHCDLLGSTRPLIAAEKAGIFKPGVPAVVWGRDGQTQPVFEQIAAAAGSPLFFAEDFSSSDNPNFRTACAALKVLGRYESEEPLLDCARLTGLRARWEILLQNPLTICDIGHNPPALKLNFERLEALRGTGVRRRPLLVVYGAMADKDVRSIASILPQDASYYLVVPNTPRAMGLDGLALNLKHLPAVRAGSVRDGVRAALREAQTLEDPIIYIGGSTYVASEAISYIESI